MSLHLKQRLMTYQGQFSPIIPKEKQYGPSVIIDCSQPLQPNIKRFEHYQLEIGRYAERRIIYDAYQQDSQNYRNIHLGIDLGVPENTPVFAPLSAIVHSFADNNQPGDYGPTIILQHQLVGLEPYTFYTLYGHLSRHSFKTLYIGKAIAQGEPFATIGNEDENGGWPSHLHFQIINSMTGHHSGNYPGICSEKELNYYLEQCPDPNLILGIPNLTLKSNQIEAD
ncbi:peptidoglycan DD-metalloendopeptidase family protein [Piscirickettsia salmonis]|uniref:peptidoglycan DD-metalloendopeptidase family protein n=1 Tax=Piscirickettsia salmonis TaxID=1238 RepID=UPI003EBD7551